MTALNICRCKACRKARRKGLILGTRRGTFWTNRWSNDGSREHYDGLVSDYIPYRKFLRGRVRKEKWHANVDPLREG